jgi:sulfur transfer complex TusBCD TusB component (DsrH family)
MSRIYRTVIAGVAALLIGTGVLAAPNDPQSLKKLMGDNFQNVHKILTDLIASNYTTLPADVEVIRRHAENLMRAPPSALQPGDDKVLFVNYATNLRASAASLITVTQELMRRDNQSAAGGELKVDYLRVVAAQHFGSMVTNCVLCHNQFRRVTLNLM